MHSIQQLALINYGDPAQETESTSPKGNQPVEEKTVKISENILSNSESSSPKKGKRKSITLSYNAGKTITSHINQSKVTIDDIISNGFEGINLSMLENIDVEESQQLILALEKTIQKIAYILDKQSKDTLVSEPYKWLEGSKLEKTYAKHCETLAVVQKNYVMKMIEIKIWDCLTIMPCKFLFESISKYMQALNSKKGNKERILTMLSFCTYWLKENQGSDLVKVFKTDIEEIMTAFPEASLTLKETFQIALQNRPNEIQISTASCGKLCFDMSKVLGGICNQQIESEDYKKLVYALAMDLRYKHAELYLQIRPQDFFKENWKDQVTPLEQFNTHCNLLSDYVFDTILLETDDVKKKQLLKFFLDVGYRSLRIRDYSSAFCVGTVVNYSDFKEIIIQNVFDECRYKLKEIIEIYLPKNNSQILRNLIDSNQQNKARFIPYLGPYLQDVQMYLESLNNPAMFNLEQATKVHESILRCLSGQEIWREKNLVYTTNFFTHIFPSYQPLSQEQREELTKPVPSPEKKISTV